MMPQQVVKFLHKDKVLYTICLNMEVVNNMLPWRPSSIRTSTLLIILPIITHIESCTDLSKLFIFFLRKFFISNDYLTFVHNFTTIAHAYDIPNTYCVSQYCTSLLEDA